MIALSGLSFRYDRSTEPVIDNLTHEFKSGTLTAVTGTSGRGKSTLLYILGQLLTPSAGDLSIDGRLVTGANDAVRARIRSEKIGFVFQDALLDPGRTILDNVLQGAIYSKIARVAAVEESFRLMERFSVEHRSDHRPGQISGGQAQRVALCRALVKRPPILLADEPSGNLDRGSANVVWQALREWAAQGAAVVVATHDVARLAEAGEVLDLSSP